MFDGTLRGHFTITYRGNHEEQAEEVVETTYNRLSPFAWGGGLLALES